jgi:hypothetical protein
VVDAEAKLAYGKLHGQLGWNLREVLKGSLSWNGQKIQSTHVNVSGSGIPGTLFATLDSRGCRRVKLPISVKSLRTVTPQRVGSPR